MTFLVDGDVVIRDRDETVPTGFSRPADAPGKASFAVYAGGQVDVSADAGAKVVFDTESTFLQSFSRTAAIVSDAVGGIVYSSAGDVRVVDCDGDGRSAGFASDYGDIAIEGGTFRDLGAYANSGDVTVTDVTCDGNTPGGSQFVSVVGSIRLTGVKIDGGLHAAIALRDVVIGAGCEFTTPSDSWGCQVASARGAVTIDATAKIDHRGGSEFGIVAGDGIRIDGRVTSASRDMKIQAHGGDLVFGAGSSVACTQPIVLGAQGAVVALGGTPTISAATLDVSCVTGDLDLDVASVTATEGRFLALANGVVRLRGTFSAARDVQLISRKDAIDVHGAALTTADAGSALSGFVRLATYSSNASIDATDAVLRTGASDAQSGDVLLQIARSGGASSTAEIFVTSAGARRLPDGSVVTRVRGTMRGRAIRAASAQGSGRVALGRDAERVMLRGNRGRVAGASDTVKMSIRGGGSRADFTLEIREPSAVTGEETLLEIDRAGFHAKGTFRRPKAD